MAALGSSVVEGPGCSDPARTPEPGPARGRDLPILAGRVRLGAIPGPGQVWTEAVGLHEDAVRTSEKKARFEEQVALRNERLVARQARAHISHIA